MTNKKAYQIIEKAVRDAARKFAFDANMYAQGIDQGPHFENA